MIPASIDESKISEGIKSMLLYAHKRLQLQKQKQLVSQTQKNKDSETNINV